MISVTLYFSILGTLIEIADSRNLLTRRKGITTLSDTEVDEFAPYTWYASAAYCQPSSTLLWDCGTNCDANPSFQPTASGGDGTDEQFWYVGYDPTLDTVIVSHQGTNPESLEADLTDADIIMENLDPDLFPGVPDDVEVHSGFAGSHAESAPDVLAAVQITLDTIGTNSVTIVGHSLGAAIALLDSVFLPLNLPLGIDFTTVGFGMPRVGNQAWANYVDDTVTSLTHINNMEDPIPTVPGMFLGFVHPSGEVHIQDSGVWMACPGQDNPSTLCIVGDVPDIFDGELSDHDGPYNGIEMGC